jgi:hypothetical protein
MSKTNEILEQLKFDRDDNVLKVSKWTGSDLVMMLETYEQAREVAKLENNGQLLMVLNEKILQLDLAIKMQTKKKAHRAELLQ